MKKFSRKLVLRSETVRALATSTLSLAVGGGDSHRCPVVFDTGVIACVAVHGGDASVRC